MTSGSQRALAVVAFGLSLMLAACATRVTPASAAETVAYVNGHWWDAGEFRERTAYVRADEFVTRPRHGAIREVNLNGGYVVPGFAEAHHHRICDQQGIANFINAGVVYVGIMNARVSSRTCQAEMHGRGGVEVLNALAGFTARNAHPWQIGQYFLEDAQIDGEWVHYVDTRVDLDRAFALVAAAPPDLLKVFLSYSEDFERLRADETTPSWYRGLDPALVPEIVHRAHARGLRVAAHVMSAHDFDVAIESGVDAVAHMPGFAPGAAFTPDQSNAWLVTFLDQPQRYLISEASARAAARRGIAVMTTMSGVEEPPSPPPPWWPSYVEFQQRVTRANLNTLRNAGVALLVGSDRYDFTSVDEAIYLVRGAFMSPVEALESLSRATPRMLFPGRNIGSLAIGAEATFVVIAQDPLVNFEAIRAPTLVVKAGNVLRPQ